MLQNENDVNITWMSFNELCINILDLIAHFKKVKSEKNKSLYIANKNKSNKVLIQ